MSNFNLTQDTTADFSSGTLTNVTASNGSLILTNTVTETHTATATQTDANFGSTYDYIGGYEFKVGASNVTVSKAVVNRPTSDIVTSYKVTIWDATSQAVVATATTNSSSTNTVTATFSSPVTLTANKNYIVSVFWTGTYMSEPSWSTFSLNSTYFTKVQGRYKYVSAGSGEVFPVTTSTTNSYGMVDLYVQSSSYATSGNREFSIDISSVGTLDTSSVSWSNTTPTNTTVSIQSSVDGKATWQTVTNGGSIPNLTDSVNTIWFRQNLSTTNTAATPSLDTFTVNVNEVSITYLHGSDSILVSDKSGFSASLNLHGNDSVTLSDNSKLTIDNGEVRLSGSDSITTSDFGKLSSVNVQFNSQDSLSFSDKSLTQINLKLSGTDLINVTDKSNLNSILLSLNGKDSITTTDVNVTKAKIERVETDLSTGTLTNTTYSSGLILTKAIRTVTGITNTTFNDTLNLTGVSFDYEVGYQFKPTRDLRVTKLKGWFGTYSSSWTTTLELWQITPTKVRVASGVITVPTSGGNVESTLATPITLTSGQTYTVSLVAKAGMTHQGIKNANITTNSAVTFVTGKYDNQGDVQDDPALTTTSVYGVPDIEFDETTTNFVTSGTRISPALDISPAMVAFDSRIRWYANTPANTSVVVETSIDGGTTWSACTNSGNIPGLLGNVSLIGKQLLVRQTLNSSNVSATPTVTMVRVGVGGYRLSVPLNLKTNVKYAVKQVYNNKTSLDYAVRREMVKALYDKYAVKTALNEKTNVKYAIQQPLNKKANFDYAVKLPLNKKSVLDYAIKLPLSDKIDVDYAIKTSLIDKTNVKYAVKNVLNNEMNVKYAVKRELASKLNEKYAIKLTLNEKANFKYAIKQPLNKNVSFDYAVKQLLKELLDVDYAVSNTFTVKVPTHIKYAIQQPLSKKLNGKYAVREPLNKPVSFDFAIKQSLNELLSVDYAVKSQLKDKMNVEYGIKLPLSKKTKLDYAVRDALSKALTIDCNVKDTTTITAKTGINYAIKNILEVPLNVKYFILNIDPIIGVYIAGDVENKFVLSGTINLEDELQATVNTEIIVLNGNVERNVDLIGVLDKEVTL